MEESFEDLSKSYLTHSVCVQLHVLKISQQSVEKILQVMSCLLYFTFYKNIACEKLRMNPR